MNVDTLLKDTFTAREHLATDADEVMAAVHERIAHRHAGLTGPLAIAASVVVMAGAASGAVVLSHHDGHQHPGPQQVQRAAGPGHAARPDQSGIAPLTMPFDLGWLPDGSVAYHARRNNVGSLSDSSGPLFEGEYMLTVTTSTAPIEVDVAQMPGDLTGIRFKSGPGEPVTIKDRQGLESANAGGPGGYELYFLGADGGLMYVNVASGTGAAVPADQLVATGRRVAENVGLPGTAQVNPTFGLGYLPAGMRIRTFDVEDGSSVLQSSSGVTGPTTVYEIGTPTGRHSAALIGTSSTPQSGTPGRAVQGHPTRYTDEGGYRSLYVLGALDEHSVQVAGRLPLAELYKIADGLVLPN